LGFDKDESLLTLKFVASLWSRRTSFPVHEAPQIEF
jgi:hypothetical protein